MRSTEIVRKVTSKVCGSLIDLILWEIALVGASVGKNDPRGVHEAFREADEILQRVNHQTLASAWYYLIKKQLLSYKKRENITTCEITNFGKKRLLQKFPEYHQKRPWDRKIYLVTYDIPTSSNTKRSKLRRFLNQIWCKLLQESVYLTPYNPRELIRIFDNKYKIPGTIIISDIGQDGGIGEIDIKDLLVKLYALEKLNQKYENFIKNAKRKSDKRMLLFEYLSILKEDPQLPFELLPRGWQGEKAYETYKKIKKEYILSLMHVFK